MTTVAEIMGMNVKAGDLGIEIETETVGAYAIPNIKGWIHKPDGSLRNHGIEYISKEPVRITDLSDHLNIWKTTLGKVHDLFDKESVSTSVHVHLNIQELSPLQVLNFYLCGVLFEGVLSRYAGVDREGNLFCLRTSDAEAHFSQIKEAVKRARGEGDILAALNPGGQQKLYTNIHTIPVKTLGTVEFRVMRGTTDIREIKVWCEVLYNIREFSKKFETPLDILKYLKEYGVEAIMREAFGAHFNEFFYDGAFKNVTKHVFYVADMASCRKEWNFTPAQPRRPKIRIQNAGIAEDGGVIDWDENFEEEDM